MLVVVAMEIIIMIIFGGLVRYHDFLYPQETHIEFKDNSLYSCKFNFIYILIN